MLNRTTEVIENYREHTDIHLNIVCYTASEFSFRIVILLFAFSDTPKMQFSKTETISVKSNEQSAKQSRLQMVFKMSTVSVHTLLQSSTLLFW